MFPNSSLLASIINSGEQTPNENTLSEEESLDNVRSRQTISDVVTRMEVTNALPGNWKMKFDLTFGDSGDLTEIAVIHHPSQLVEYHLEPVETYKPLSATHVSVEHANSAEEDLTTASEFKEACKAVVSHTKKLEQRTQRPSEADWNSASPEGVQGPNPNRSPASL